MIEEKIVMTIRKQASSILGLLVLAGMLGASAQAQDEQIARLRAALASPERSAENKERDAARKPVEVIQFLGVQDGMTALDVFAVGGWYTEVLSAAVGPTGKVYSQNPEFFTGRPGFVEAETERNERLGNVEPIHGEIAAAGINGQVDIAITNQNLHDMFNRGGEAGAMPISRASSTRSSPAACSASWIRRNRGADNAQLHRMEVAAARDLLIKAGFTIEAESDLLANPADDHTRGPGDASLGGNSDRFLIKARKPN
jgi:predicted methyltransferase